MLHELCRQKQSLELWTVSTCFPLSETNDQFTAAFYVTTPTKKKKPRQTKKIGHKISQAIHKRRVALLHLACCHTINCRQYKINYYYMNIQYILILITFTTAALKKNEPKTGLLSIRNICTCRISPVLYVHQMLTTAVFSFMHSRLPTEAHVDTPTPSAGKGPHLLTSQL
jgi:hypothetical protein